MVRLVNLRDGSILVEELDIRSSFTGRLLGFMGRPRPSDGQGILLMGVRRVHTAFLRFPLDLLFLDGSLRVVGILHGVPPFRFPSSPPGCRHILEIPSGDGRRGGDPLPGDRLILSVRVAG
jgi:uncharacterized membrane protein (UPF0127 family)